MEPCGRTAPTSMKRRTSALKFLLFSVIAGSVAAAIAFVVLRCFRKSRIEKKSDGFKRFLSDSANKDLVGACGVAFEEESPSAPFEEREGSLSLSLSESVRTVLNSARNAVASFQRMAGPPYSREWLAMFLRLMTFVGLELGALSMLLEGSLEEERKAVVEDVMTLAIEVLRAIPLHACRSRVRYRIRGGIRLLEKSINHKAIPVPLSQAQREEKLKHLLKIQRFALKHAEELAKKLEDLTKRGVEHTSPEAKLIGNQLGVICHQRKRLLLRDAHIFTWIQQLEQLSGIEFLGLPVLTRYLETHGPPPPVDDQIQGLQAALFEAGHLTEGPAFHIGTPPQSRTDEAADSSTPQRQPDAAPPTDLLHADGSLLQAQPQGAPQPQAEKDLARQRHPTGSAISHIPSTNVSSALSQPAGHSPLQPQATGSSPAHLLTGESLGHHQLASSAPPGVHFPGGHSEWPPELGLVPRHYAPADDVSSSHLQVSYPFLSFQPLSAQAQPHAIFEFPTGPGAQARSSDFFLGVSMNVESLIQPLPHSGKFYGVPLGEPVPTELPHGGLFYGFAQGMPQPPDTEN